MQKVILEISFKNGIFRKVNPPRRRYPKYILYMKYRFWSGNVYTRYHVEQNMHYNKTNITGLSRLMLITQCACKAFSGSTLNLSNISFPSQKFQGPHVLIFLYLKRNICCELSSSLFASFLSGPLWRSRFRTRA